MKYFRTVCKRSTNTYHKSLKQLHEAKYIYYPKLASRFQEVRISIVRLDREEEQSPGFKQLNLFEENEEAAVLILRPVRSHIATNNKQNK